MVEIAINNWSDYKSTIASKSLLIQYSEDPTTYQIYAAEEAFIWTISLLKGTSDATDFEDNHQASANRPLLDFPNVNFYNTSTTETLKSGVGKLHTIVFSKTGTLLTTNLSIYDNTAASGKVIYQTSFGTAAVSPLSLDFHCRFDTGLTIVTDSTNHALTVIWE